MKEELGGKIMKEFAALRAKTYNYSTDNSDEDKKAKDTKKRVIKSLEFKDHKNCLEVNQLENEINQLEKNKTDMNSFKKYHKGFIKSNKLVLKLQQRIE